MAKKKGTGRSVKGGGKSRTNKDHRHAYRRGIVKGRCVAQRLSSFLLFATPPHHILTFFFALDSAASMLLLPGGTTSSRPS